MSTVSESTALYTPPSCVYAPFAGILNRSAAEIAFCVQRGGPGSEHDWHSDLPRRNQGQCRAMVAESAGPRRTALTSPQ